jgi:hypothetical protein
VLLNYFGEAAAACGNCDTCLDPPESGTAPKRRAKRSAALRTGQRFGAEHLIDVLRGTATDKVQQFGHQELPTFGVGADLDDHGWRAVFRQLLATGLLHADAQAYGALQLTESARPLLRGECTLSLRRAAARTIKKFPQGRTALAAMKRVDDFRLKLGSQELVPIMVGGMGVDISTAELALEVARLGGVGHISDAMVPTVSDRRFNTKYVKNKLQQYKFNVANSDKSVVQVRPRPAGRSHRDCTSAAPWSQARPGMVFINCMEKLTMNAPKETLRVRLKAAMDARHRRHHAGGRPAPGLVRPDRGPSALSRRQAGHHRFLAARAAALPQEERAHQPPARLRGDRRARSPAATSASAWTGRSTTSPPSSPKSATG